MPRWLDTKEQSAYSTGDWREAPKLSDTELRMADRELLPRAPRLLIRAPVTLRTSSRMPWREGWTINISQSGLLVAVASPVNLSGDVELVVSLSKGALQGPGVPLLPDLHCRGHIVRHEPGDDGAWTIAANIRRQVVRVAGLKSGTR
jgi:hypothetical protein